MSMPQLARQLHGEIDDYKAWRVGDGGGEQWSDIHDQGPSESRTDKKERSHRSRPFPSRPSVLELKKWERMNAIPDSVRVVHDHQCRPAQSE